MSKTRALLHRLLYIALVEIRYQSIEGSRDVAFKISDTFHNVPLGLLNIDSERDHELLLQEVMDRAQSREIGDWFLQCAAQQLKILESE